MLKTDKTSISGKGKRSTSVCWFRLRLPLTTTSHLLGFQLHLGTQLKLRFQNSTAILNYSLMLFRIEMDL